MFFSKKSCPKWERKVAYADLTNKGKGILQQNVYNAVVHDGQLSSTPGFFQCFDTPGHIEGFAVDPNIYFYIATAKGLYFRTYSLTKLSDKFFSRPSFAYHSSSKTMLVTSTFVRATYAHIDGAFEKVFDVGFQDMAVYCDRCFGIRNNMLYFTERGSVTNWSGQIQLPQNATALAVTDEGLYVVAHDLYLLEFDDNESDSKLTLVYRNFGQCLPQSVKSVGKGFMYLTNDGVHYFNGSGIKHVATLPEFGTNSAHNPATVHNGKYCVTYIADIVGDEYRMAVVDIHTQQVLTIYKKKAYSMLSAFGSLYVSVGESIFEVFDKPLPVVWESRPYNFGSNSAQKSFDSLLINTAGDVTVTLRTETETRILHVKGSKKTQKIPLHGNFHCVTLTVESEGRIYVESIAVVANVLKEEVY